MSTEPIVPQQLQSVEEAVAQSRLLTADPGIATIEGPDGLWHRWRGRGFRAKGKGGRVETRCRRLIRYIDARTANDHAVTCERCAS